MSRKKNEIAVLLVDDEADIRDVLEISVSDFGYPVLSAKDGAEGWSRFLHHQPSIVLTDIKMPGMDGIELLKRVKQENPDTEVIMITGHGDMDLAIKSLKHEATDFITKPINVEALEIALQRACNKIVMRDKLKAYTESLELLIHEKTELQDHLSSLGLMIGSVSHGIKGLITGLDGGMYLINSGLKAEDFNQIKEGWAITQIIVERVRKLVSDILYYAKERELKREKTDIKHFAGELAKVIKPKINQLGIRFIYNDDIDGSSLDIDADAIHSALVNILENAVDACVKDQNRTDHLISFTVCENRDCIHFFIEDNGLGMDAATRGKIFDLFYSSKATEGTGFGLFISNKIISQHGGSIRVESVLGKGSCFTVSLPKACSTAP